jgi:hypothetical protein
MKRSSDTVDHLLPTDGADIIPAFSLVELSIASKNSDAAEGKCTNINIMKIRRLPSDVSVHGVAGVLDRMPSNLNDALLASSMKAVEYPWISADLVKDNVAFFKKKCSVNTMCSVVDITDKNGVSSNFVRLSQWSDDLCECLSDVDLHEAAVLRLTNVKKIEHAIALLQVAISMDSVSLFVAHDPFLSKSGGSCLHGVALINAAKMLAAVKFDPASVTPGAKSVVFDTGFSYDDGEGGRQQAITLDVGTEPVVSASPEDVPSPDFPISLGYSTPKGYDVVASFSAALPDKVKP